MKTPITVHRLLITDYRLLMTGIITSMMMLTGCAFLTGVDSDGYPVPKKFNVEISSLDWMIVDYYPRQGDPVFAMPCRLEFHGSGEIEFRTGRSPQVSSGFTTKVDSPYWNEMFTDRRHIGPDAMERFFQSMVDAGLFPKMQNKAALRLHGEEGDAHVRIKATIKYDKTTRVTDDPRILRALQPYLNYFRETARVATEATGMAP